MIKSCEINEWYPPFCYAFPLVCQVITWLHHMTCSNGSISFWHALSPGLVIVKCNRGLLQSTSGIIKCDRNLLQSASVITNCDRLLFRSVSGITKCDRLLLQLAPGIAKYDSYYKVIRNTRYTSEDKWVWLYCNNNDYKIKDRLNITSQTKRKIVGTVLQLRK